MADVADLIIHGGQVLTMDPQNPSASAVAVRGGHILYVGDDQSCNALAGPATRSIDARGGTILPGFIDCHAHLLSYGESLVRLDLRGMKRFADVVALVAEAAAKLPPGRWLLGRGWDNSPWGGDTAIDRAALSTAAPDNPVFLNRYDGHAAIVNDAAMALAGLDDTAADPKDGALGRDSGRLTGLLIEKAADLVSRHIPPPDAVTRRELMALAGETLLRYGVTGIFDAVDKTEWIDDFRSLLADNVALPRIFGLLRAGASDDAAALEPLLFSDAADGRLSLRRLRMVLDGGMGPRGASMHEPYSDDPSTSGYLMLPPERVASVSATALANGWSMCVHAIGDRAIDALLDAWEPLLTEHPGDHRFMIEHCVVPTDAALVRLSRLGIIASVQPSHAAIAGRWITARLGPGRAAQAYAYRRLRDAGLKLAMGTDFPVASPDPRTTLSIGATRRYRDDAGQEQIWAPEQSLPVGDILRGYTSDAAFTAFAEDSLGTLRPGFRADIVVMQGDLLGVDAAAIAEVSVTATVLGGCVVFQA